MGALAAGLFSTHVPRLMILDPEQRRAYMGRTVTTFYDALESIRRERIAPLAFDTFVIIDTHWHATLEFVINGHGRLEGVYTSDEIPWMIHDYAYDYPGDPELAALVAEEAQAAGVPALVSAHRGLPVHYGTLNPMHYYNPGPQKRRVLAISVCDTAETEVNVRFGEVLARAVARSDRRVLLVASGGMSHRFWPLATIRERASADPADISEPALRAFDERIMACWRDGDHATVLREADRFRATCSPEGRFAHYLVLAGAFGGAAWRAKGEQFGRYEAAIGTGQACFWFGEGSRMKRSAFTGGAAALASIAIVRAPARAATWSYKYAHNLPVSHPLHVRAREMWDEVRTATGGRLDVQIFPNNQLGGDPAVLSQLRSGAVHFFSVSGGLLGAVVPVAQIENVGFAFRSAEAAFAAMDGALGAYVRREMATRDIVGLPHVWDNGMRQMTSATKPIATPADLQGFKMRTPPGALWVDLFRTLGASPAPIAGAELYTSLQTHVVDGQENALAGIEATRLYEVQRFLSLSNHMWAGYWMIANGAAWRALPPDVTAIVTRANERYARAQRRDVALLNASLADKLQRRGMTIVAQVDQAPFKARLGPFYTKWRGEFGAAAWELLERASGPLG